MNRKSRGRESSCNRSSSIIKKNKNRKSFHQSSNVTFELSQIPRAVETPVEHFAEIKSTHFFEPAESQIEYLKLFDDVGEGKWPETRLFVQEDSKQQNIWRCLERLNNEGNSSSFQQNQSSYDFLKTSKKNLQQAKSLLLPIKSQVEYTPEFTSQIIQSEQDNRSKTPKKESLKLTNMSIRNELDIKYFPPNIKNQMKEDLTQHEYQQIYIKRQNNNEQQATQKKNLLTGMTRLRIVPLHERRNKKEKRKYEKTSQLVQIKLSQYKTDDYQIRRDNKFQLRQSRMKPLKFWKGERISYKINGNHSIWKIKESD